MKSKKTFFNWLLRSRSSRVQLLLFLILWTIKYSLAWQEFASSYFPGRFWPQYTAAEPDLAYWARIQSGSPRLQLAQHSSKVGPTWVKRYNELLNRRKLNVASTKNKTHSAVVLSKDAGKRAMTPSILPRKDSSPSLRTNQPRPIASMNAAKANNASLQLNRAQTYANNPYSQRQNLEVPTNSYPLSEAFHEERNSMLETSRNAFYPQQATDSEKKSLSVSDRNVNPFEPALQAFMAQNFPADRRAPDLHITGVTAFGYEGQGFPGSVASSLLPETSFSGNPVSSYLNSEFMQVNQQLLNQNNLPYSAFGQYATYQNPFTNYYPAQQAFAKGDIFAGTVHNYVPTFKIHPTYTNNFPTKSPKSTKKLVENLRLGPLKNLYAKKQPKKVTQVVKPLSPKPAMNLMFPDPSLAQLGSSSKSDQNSGLLKGIDFATAKNLHREFDSSHTTTWPEPKPLNGFQRAAIRHEMIRNSKRKNSTAQTKMFLQRPQIMSSDQQRFDFAVQAFEKANAQSNKSTQLDSGATAAKTISSAKSELPRKPWGSSASHSAGISLGNSTMRVGQLTAAVFSFPKAQIDKTKPVDLVNRGLPDSIHSSIFPGPRIARPIFEHATIRSTNRHQLPRVLNRTLKSTNKNSIYQLVTSQNAQVPAVRTLSTGLRLQTINSTTTTTKETDSAEELRRLGFSLNQNMHKRGRISIPYLMKHLELHFPWIKRARIPLANDRDTEEFGLTKERIQAYIRRLESEKLADQENSRLPTDEVQHNMLLSRRNFRKDELEKPLNSSDNLPGNKTTTVVHDDEANLPQGANFTRSRVERLDRGSNAALSPVSEVQDEVTAFEKKSEKGSLNQNIPLTTHDDFESSVGNTNSLVNSLTEAEADQRLDTRLGKVNRERVLMHKFTSAITKSRDDHSKYEHESETGKAISYESMIDRKHSLGKESPKRNFRKQKLGEQIMLQARSHSRDHSLEDGERLHRRTYHPVPITVHDHQGDKKSLLPAHDSSHLHDIYEENDEDDEDDDDDDEESDGEQDDDSKGYEDDEDDHDREDLYTDNRSEEEAEGLETSKQNHHHSKKSSREKIARVETSNEESGPYESHENYNPIMRQGIPILNINTPDTEDIRSEMQPLITEPTRAELDVKKSRLYEPSDVQILQADAMQDQAQQNLLEMLNLHNKIVSDRLGMIENLKESYMTGPRYTLGDPVDDGRGDITLRHHIANAQSANPGAGSFRQSFHRNENQKDGGQFFRKSGAISGTYTSAVNHHIAERMFPNKFKEISSEVASRKSSVEAQGPAQPSLEATANTTSLARAVDRKSSVEGSLKRKSSLEGYSVLDRGKLLHDGLLGGFNAPAKPAHKVTEEEDEARKEELEAQQLIGKALQTNAQKIPDPQEVIGLENAGARKLNKADVMAHLGSNVMPDLSVVSTDNSGMDVNSLQSNNLDAAQLPSHLSSSLPSSLSDGMENPDIPSSSIADMSAASTGIQSSLAGFHSSVVDEADTNNQPDKPADWERLVDDRFGKKPAADRAQVEPGDRDDQFDETSDRESNSANLENTDSLPNNRPALDNSMTSRDASDHDVDGNVGADTKEGLGKFTKDRDRDMDTTDNDERSDRMDGSDNRDDVEDRDTMTDAKGELLNEDSDRGAAPEDRGFEEAAHAQQRSQGDSSIEVTLHGNATPQKIKMALENVADNENVEKLIAQAKHASDREMEEVLKNNHMEARPDPDSRRDKKQNLKRNRSFASRKRRQKPLEEPTMQTSDQSPILSAFSSTETTNLIPNPLIPLQNIETSSFLPKPLLPVPSIESNNLFPKLLTPDTLQMKAQIAPAATVSSDTLSNTQETIDPPIKGMEYIAPDGTVLNTPLTNAPNTIITPEGTGAHGEATSKVGSSPKNGLPDEVYVGPPLAEVRKAPDNLPPVTNFVSPFSESLKIPPDVSSPAHKESLGSHGVYAIGTLNNGLSQGSESSKARESPSKQDADINVTGVANDRSSGEIMNALKELENLKAETKTVPDRKDSSTESHHFTARNSTEDEKNEEKTHESHIADHADVESETKEAVKDLTLAIRMLEKRLAAVRSQSSTVKSSKSGHDFKLHQQPNEIITPGATEASLRNNAERRSQPTTTQQNMQTETKDTPKRSHLNRFAFSHTKSPELIFHEKKLAKRNSQSQNRLHQKRNPLGSGHYTSSPNVHAAKQQRKRPAKHYGKRKKLPTSQWKGWNSAHAQYASLHLQTARTFDNLNPASTKKQNIPVPSTDSETWVVT